MHPALDRGVTGLGHLCRLALALVLMTAGVLKALDPEALARETAQYGLLPGPLVTPFAFLLIPAEIVVGAALLLDWRRVLSMAAACGLMAIFIGAIAFALATGKPLEACGCFGSHVPRTPSQTLVEDAGLLAAGLFGLWALGRTGRAAGTLPEGRRAPAWKGGVVALVAAVSAAFTVASPRLPIDNLATALAPGVVWSELGVTVAERDFSRGRHLVAILGLNDDPSGAVIAPMNRLAAEPGWETTGLYAGNEEKLVEFTFMRGPAFPLYAMTPADLGRLHRRLPRFFAVDEGRVAATWSELPDAAAVRESLGVAPDGARGSLR